MKLKSRLLDTHSFNNADLLCETKAKSDRTEKNVEAVKLEMDGKMGKGWRKFKGGGASSIRISAAPQRGKREDRVRRNGPSRRMKVLRLGRGVRMKNCHSLHSLHYTGTKHDGRYLT